MTDAEKLADYDRITKIIEDEIALEAHSNAKRSGFGAVQFYRSDAFFNIVRVVMATQAPEQFYYG